MDFKTLGIKPISKEYPAGKNIRYDSEFEILQAEITKLVSGDQIEWEQVSKLSSDILSKKSKDILVAGYFTVAQININKIDGLIIGLEIYHDILQNFWDDMYPSLDRIRGRISAFEWWAEKTRFAVSKWDIDEIPLKKKNQIIDILGQIEDLLNSYLTAPFLLDNIKNIFKFEPISKDHDIPVINDLDPYPEKSNIATQHTENLFDAAFREIQKASQMLRQSDNTTPKAYRNNRIAVWSVLEALPPDINSRTRVYAPESHIRNHIKVLREKKNWRVVLETVESELCRSLFWLDLNRFAAEALAFLGDEYQRALDAVCIETAFFIHRLSGLEYLLFSNGTPFADNETRQWLDSIDFWARAAVPEPLKITQYAKFPAYDKDEFPVPSKIKQAEDTVKTLHAKLQKNAGPKELLSWRLALAKILINMKQIDFAIPHLQECLNTIEKYKLEKWDPGLAVKVLKTIWEGYSAETSYENKALAIFNRIVKIDLSEAMALQKEKKRFSWGGFRK